MASLLHFSPIFLTLLLFHTFLTSPADSLTCTSQTFTKTTPHYTNCSDLPALKAYLHWAYDPTKSSLSIAFIAPPAKPDGWIAWGINPISTGMVGAQTLVALKDSNGSLLVKTYNLSSYRSIEETSKLSFKVVDSNAENVNGTMKIFATLALPKNMTEVNHVWQVGGGVLKNGMPEKHEFAPENLSSKGTLELVKAAESNGTAVAAGGAGGETKNGTASGGGAQSGNETGQGSRMWNCGGVVYGFLVIFGILFLGF